MNSGNDVGTRHVEDLITAFKLLVVLHGGVVSLQHGAHGAIGYHHTRSEGVEQGLRTNWQHSSHNLFSLVASWEPAPPA